MSVNERETGRKVNTQGVKIVEIDTIQNNRGEEEVKGDMQSLGVTEEYGRWRWDRVRWSR